MGDNVDVARALALVHVHTARALFFIILIILKAKLIFLILAIFFSHLMQYLQTIPRKGKYFPIDNYISVLKGGGVFEFGPSAAFEVSLSESAV